MPPEPAREDSPEVWLRYAESDLAIASGPRTERALPIAYCFHAQQAAEKAIKAVYLSRALDFDRIHDLKALLDGLDDVPTDVASAAQLTPFAVLMRYPADLGEGTERDLAEAIELATAVVAWAALQIGDG